MTPETAKLLLQRFGEVTLVTPQGHTLRVRDLRVMAMAQEKAATYAN